MVNRNLLHQYDLSDEDLVQLDELVPEDGTWFPLEQENFSANKIVNGRVLEIRGEDVIIDIGYKSEGIIKLEEWKEDGTDKPSPPQVGENIQVLLETLEDELSGPERDHAIDRLRQRLDQPADKAPK